MDGILSIQSWVAWGHVGNAAAMFPLQRLGFEVWGVNTVQFSNHPGWGGFRGEVFAPEDIRSVIEGIEARGAFATCHAVLSGYLGDVKVGEAVLDAVVRVKAANPAALWCCDPVMGDAGRFYVRDGIPAFFRDRALALADIVTPNPFELEYLTGRKVGSLADALAAARDLQAMGPRIVLLTSLDRDDGPADAIEMLAVDGAGAWLVATPRLALSPNGAGDAVAALFLGHLLRGGDTRVALEAAASAIHAVLETTMALGEREIQIVAAQDRLDGRGGRFQAVAVG
jgi:pyridoxine kinase